MSEEPQPLTLDEIIRHAKREAIHASLLRNNGCVASVARELQRNRTELYRLCQALEVQPALYRENARQ